MNIIVVKALVLLVVNFVFHMLKKHPDYRIICLDKLTLCRQFVHTGTCYG